VLGASQIMGNETFLLFAVPNFLCGAAAVFDPTDSLSQYNESETGAEADMAATFADWKAVANDLKSAIESEAPRVESQQPKV